MTFQPVLLEQGQDSLGADLYVTGTFDIVAGERYLVVCLVRRSATPPVPATVAGTGLACSILNAGGLVIDPTSGQDANLSAWLGTAASTQTGIALTIDGGGGATNWTLGQWFVVHLEDMDASDPIGDLQSAALAGAAAVLATSLSYAAAGNRPLVIGWNLSAEAFDRPEATDGYTQLGTEEIDTAPDSALGLFWHPTVQDADPTISWPTADAAGIVALELIAIAGGTTHFITPSGAVTPAGALAKRPSKVHAGAATPAGAIAKRPAKAHAGAIASSGALSRSAARRFTGSIAPAGSLQRSTSKALAGAIASSGALSTVRLVARAFSGTVAPAGSLQRSTSKALAGAAASSGSLQRSSTKALAGAAAPSGTLRKLLSRPLSGSLAPSGTLTRQLVKLVTFAGTIAPSGALQRLVSKRAAGAVTPAGSLAKRPSKAHAGAIASSGTLARAATKRITLAGALAPAGSLRRQAAKLAGGAIAPAGSLRRAVAKAAVGTLAPTGALSRAVSKALAAAVAPAGDVDLEADTVEPVVLDLAEGAGGVSGAAAAGSASSASIDPGAVTGGASSSATGPE